MGIPILILGDTGSGKSTALENLDPKECLLIKAANKPLPFRNKGWDKFNKKEGSGSVVSTDNWDHIKKGFKLAYQLKRNKIIIDDFQYVMANEFMRRHDERGFDKFTEIGYHAWSIIMAAQAMPGDARIYILSHTEEADAGKIKIKTIGKMLDEKITVEGMFTIVIRAIVSDQNHSFSTKNSGSDTVKCPKGMFEESLIPNDLSIVDRAVCDYYGIK